MKTKTSLGILLTSLVVLCSLITGCSSKEVQDEEKELLITVRDLEGYGITINDPTNYESFLIKRNLDGSKEIEYEYDSEKDPNSIDTLWLKSEAEILGTANLAHTSFNDRISAYKVGVSLGSNEVEITEGPMVSTLGDESYSAYLEKNGKKLGNILVVRKEDTVFSLLIAGLYFDDPQILHDLMSPRIEKAGEIK